MSDDDRIPSCPLDEGDQFAIDVTAGNRDAGDTHDTFVMQVPIGSGLVVAYWLQRILTETPELRHDRRQADHLASVKAGAA